MKLKMFYWASELYSYPATRSYLVFVNIRNVAPFVANKLTNCEHCIEFIQKWILSLCTTLFAESSKFWRGAPSPSLIVLNTNQIIQKRAMADTQRHSTMTWLVPLKMTLWNVMQFFESISFVQNYFLSRMQKQKWKTHLKRLGSRTGSCLPLFEQTKPEWPLVIGRWMCTFG